jgi:hypothetical protein
MNYQELPPKNRSKLNFRKGESDSEMKGGNQTEASGISMLTKSD